MHAVGAPARRKTGAEVAARWLLEFAGGDGRSRLCLTVAVYRLPLAAQESFV